MSKINKINNYFSTTNKRTVDDDNPTPPIKVKLSDEIIPEPDNVASQSAIIQNNDIGLFINSNLKDAEKNLVSNL